MLEVLERHTVKVPGERLDAWVFRVFERVGSRSSAHKKVRAGLVRLNGEVVCSSRYVREGDEVVLLPDPRVPTLDLGLEVLFADPVCAVVAKPAGILVNGNRHRTLENALPPALGPSPHPRALVRPRPCHRLDFETAGPVAVGRTDEALRFWVQAFQERRVQKRYRAIVVGRLEGEHQVDLPLDGRPACSRIRSLEVFPALKTDACTVVELEPVTGRMHQLRRHLEHLGHPILGDKRYHGGGPILRGNGLFLCATRLVLPHPSGDGAVDVEGRVPAKFESFRAREVRRWNRWHGS